MTQALSFVAFALGLTFYGASTILFFLEIAPHRSPKGSAGPGPQAAPTARSAADLRPMIQRTMAAAGSASRGTSVAPRLLGVGALSHAAYVTFASFIAHVCPVHSVHFILSVASLLAIACYLVARLRFKISALGLIVSPLGLAFLLGTYFLGKPGPEPKLSSTFIALHVMANLLGVALFLLAGGAAALYLVQEKRLKQKRPASRIATLPPLDILDRAVHRFLVAGFPLLTVGIVTGTFWAHHLEMGTPDEVMRIVLGYTTWLLVAGVLVLRVAAGWRGRRAAYGTIAGFACAAAVLVIYLVRPAAGVGG